MGYFPKRELAIGLNLDESYDTLPDEPTLDETKRNVEERNIVVSVFEDSEDAREHLIGRIPAHSTVMNGRSTTMHDIGFVEYLQQEPNFSYLKTQIQQIEDDDERRDARRKAITADVFFDSPNAIAATGEIIGVNGLGTSIGAWPYGANRLVLVSGTNKIVPTLEEAIDRVRDYAYPLEDARVQKAKNHRSMIGKLLIYEFEKLDHRTELVLIDGNYGF